MHPQAIRDIAQRIANESLADLEFSAVYEDDEVQDLTEIEWAKIHDLVTRAKAVLPE